MRRLGIAGLISCLESGIVVSVAENMGPSTEDGGIISGKREIDGFEGRNVGAAE